MGERKRSRTMRQAAIAALITVVLTTAFLAATWKAHAQPSAGYIEVINYMSTVVPGGGPLTGLGSFSAALTAAATYSALNPSLPPPMILAGPGYTDTLSASLTISVNGLWIIGAPSRLCSSKYPAPKINLNSYTITIHASNVFIWGLDISQSGTSWGLCISGSSNTIENNTIDGSSTGMGSPNAGIWLVDSSSNNNIALNTISTWYYGVWIAGSSSSNTVELNTLKTYTYGVYLSGGSGNMIWWNNLMCTSATNAIWDASTNPNAYDNLGKGNFYNGWDSVVPGTPYPIPPNFVNVDHHPLSSSAKQIPGDITGGPNGCPDGIVNLKDLTLLVAAWPNGWGSYKYDPRADLNGMGTVNIIDVAILARNWMRKDPPPALSAVSAGVGTADPSTTVYIYPSMTTATVGQTITVSIAASTVSNLVGWQAGITFNPNVLTCLGVQEGPFLSQEGLTLWIPGAIDNATGTVGLSGCALCGNSTTANGTGTLATVTFICNSVGSSTCTLEDVMLVNSTIQEIPTTISGGQVTVTVPPSVGGTAVSVNELAFFAPYVGLTSILALATVATAICTKRVKRAKEKQ